MNQQRTTMIINKDVQRELKILAAKLDKTQGETIRFLINQYEKENAK